MSSVNPTFFNLTSLRDVLCLFVFIAVGNAQASSSAWNEAETERAKIEMLATQVSPTRAPACPTRIDAYRGVVFAFDGARDYCPFSAFVETADPDFGGKTVFDRLIELRNTRDENGDPSNKLFNRVQATAISFVERARDEALVSTCHLQRFITNRMEATEDPYAGILYSFTSPDGHGKKILYYAWDQVADALTCATSLNTLATQTRRNLQVSIMGYSLGGTTAAEFYERLSNRRALKIRQLLTIDPVPRNPMLIGSLIGRPVIVDITTEVPFGKWRNFIQRSDSNSLTNQVGIQGVAFRGSPLKIRNTLITAHEFSRTTKGWDMDVDPDRLNKAHQRILLHPGLAKTYQELLRN